MSNVIVKLNTKAVSELLLKSPEMQSIVSDLGNSIASRAGDGYVCETHIGANRCYANVRTATYKARRDNAKNNTLLRSMK